ncbi:hypothetical protein APHAL10511_000989 [Amanita phalloides]|nr:hypothetical protein APHAL10511_000989 [Amanita phalloides]
MLLAISKDEFKHWFTKCRPPTGWSKVIAVANSGGPDSTCLLFLLHRYLSDLALQDEKHALPRQIMSMAVDHHLQPSSTSMAESCAKYARSLPGVEHATIKVPWSTPPFPTRPLPGVGPFENTARMARYEILYRCMNSVHPERDGPINVIAFGHHADDQVETALMRFRMGTTELGGGGMRPCRRWGMGYFDKEKGENSLGWAGFGGMNKWVVRPLLDVNKNRILATCEENQLEYVTDESNFQPHLTLRNAIRKMLSSGRNLDDIESVCPEPLPPTIKEQLSHIDSAISSVESLSVDLTSGVERLRSAVKQLTTQVEDIDAEVDSHLKRCRIPSPPGTLLLSLRGLFSVHDELVRTALILRVMRYVSFHPWGSMRADGNRRKRMREQILEKLWTLNPFEQGRGMFVAGGGVLWTPVLVRGTKIKTPDRVTKDGISANEVIAWLASRQPPLNKRKMEQLEMYNPLQIDVTDKLKQSLDDASGASSMEVMYDCRFLVRFDFANMPLSIYNGLRGPDSQIQILIVPDTRWYWPEIVLKQGDEARVLHSDIGEEVQLHPLGKPVRDRPSHKMYWKRPGEPIVSSWIHVEWIRPLSAL